ncbi:23S rRNA m(5)U-1939 methyltransferase [Thalassococcus halodurans]|uniref:23S rRNA m(5)U-1939 methyltransferase n=1 Tax=Thalassococcus halodurans TaxID=373675 RepID=A0A1H5Z5L4_9RHOB|nr:class I SAM-dependent RNA methyltransferase [Thalassococcus halodurans]SEG30626.1 23S rRNA m(5)U-1939 methyltransferase [Thalassococcus halodurans]
MEQYKIDRLGHQGDGIAEGPVYVPGALPGEIVQGTLDGSVLRDAKIIEPSSDRVRPPCSHAKSCGGCQLQHASDDFVAKWKMEVVERALAAHGITTQMRPILTSPAQSRRRAAFSAKRTKKAAIAGFHKKQSDIVIAIPNCQLVHPDVMAALPLVEELAVVGGSRKGEISVLVTLTDNGLDLYVSGGKPIDDALRITLSDLTRKYNIARISWDDEIALQREKPILRLGNAPVSPPPGAFLQATKDGEAALVAAVREIVGSGKRVADLFAGCGTFALPLAEKAEVLAVEGDKAMTHALEEGWRQGKNLKKLTPLARDLFRNPLLPDELAKMDALVIDPPRAGAEAQVAQIAKSNVPVIAHVSCNPTTFARDCGTLIAAGYQLDWVQTVDQFRWSTHVEVVGCLTKRK